MTSGPASIVPYPVTAASSPSRPGTARSGDQAVRMGKSISSYLPQDAIASGALLESSGPVMLSPQDSVSQVGDQSESGRSNTSEKPLLHTAQSGSVESPPASGSSSHRQFPPPPSPPPIPVHSSPQEIRNVDSGLRFPQTATPSEIAPLDAPPEYTPN